MKHNKKLLAAAVLLAMVSALVSTRMVSGQSGGAAASPSTATLFEGARLIVGDGTTVIENAAFLVERDKFTKIGRKGEIQAPVGAAVVDLTGKTVMPGIVDTHTHAADTVDSINKFAYWGVGAAASMGQTAGDRQFALRANPGMGALFLTCGIGMNGPLGAATAMEIGEGTAAGAGRASAEAAGVRGGTAPAAGRGAAAPAPDPEDGVRQPKTEAEARAIVRALAAQKVDCVKIWVDDRLGTEVSMSPYIYRAVIDEAHKVNLQVIAHAFYLKDFKDLVASGVDGLAHPVRDAIVDDEMLALLKAHPKTYFQTNMDRTLLYALKEPPAWVSDPGLAESDPQAAQTFINQFKSSTVRTHEGQRLGWDKWAFSDRTYRTIVENYKKLFAAGVPIAVGTDSSGQLGFRAHLEMLLLVKDVGLTPMQAITAATSMAARAMRQDLLGTIAAAKTANFIVLDANPLDDINNSRRIGRVFLRGSEVDRAALRAGWRPAAK